jgi:PPM family protein phosphatase
MSSSDSDTVEIPLEVQQARRAEPPPASIQVAVELAAATHVGHVRSRNEDAYLVARADRSLETLLTNLPDDEVPSWAAERSYGLIVADGMGGHAAGEVASHVALRAVLENVLDTADWIMRDAGSHLTQIEQRIAERFVAADQAVHDQAVANPRWAGMGTTMTLALSNGPHLFLGHIGDSRAYLLRGGQLEILTHDHSFAQALADSGVIAQAEVARHSMRNVLLRSLGGGHSKADVRHLMLASGDQLLLCTDGLTDMVAEPQIAEILHATASSQAGCDALVAAALDAGGKDNITVVLARYAWHG